LGLLSLKLLIDAYLIFVLYPAALPAQTSETAQLGSLGNLGWQGSGRKVKDQRNVWEKL